MQEPLIYAWTKENGELPTGRCSDPSFGLLIISQVESADSGTYVCTVTAGRFQVKKDLELKVEGQFVCLVKKGLLIFCLF